MNTRIDMLRSLTAGLLLALLFPLVSCTDQQPPPEPISNRTKTTETDTAGAPSDIIVMTGGDRAEWIREHGERPAYSVEIRYPRLEGMPNVEIFNRAIHDSLTAEVAAFKRNVKELAAEMTAEDLGDSIGSSLSGDYTVELRTPKLFSVVQDLEFYTFGAAHGGRRTLGFTVDLTTGRLLTLADLFRPGADYLDAISTAAIDDLMKQLGSDVDEQWLGQGAGPEPENFDTFALTDKGLLIMFQEYQVGPYAIGAPEVTIPYKALKDVIDMEGVMAGVLR